MRYGKLRYAYVAAALGVAAIGADYTFSRGTVEAQAIRNPLTSNINVASRIDDFQAAAKQTAAVVEGWVTDIRHEYSEEQGPWTIVTLSNVHSHFGEAPSTFEIRHFGGPLPDGRTIVIAELPVFVRGKQYVVFLRNTGWNLSPVVGDFALRVETVDRKEVLVNSDGQAVTEVNSTGVDVGPTLFDAHDLTGAAPKALVDKLDPAGRLPLDRARFVDSLATTLKANRITIGGRISTRPLGQFKWRGQTAERAPGDAIPQDPKDKTGGIEKDVDASPSL